MANITRNDIFAAAEEISTSGQAPTVANVRAKLGSGSYTTITAALRDWKATATTRQDDTPDVPDPVRMAMERATVQIWQAANDHLASELTAVRKAAEETTRAQAEQITQGETEIARLENLTTEQEKTIHAQGATIQEQQAVIESLRRDLVELRTQAKADAARIKEQSALLTALTTTKPSKAKPTTTTTTTA